MKLKQVILATSIASVVVTGIGAGIKGINKLEENRNKKYVSQAYNLSPQEYQKLDSTITSKGEGFLGFKKERGWRKAIDSLENRNSSLDIAAKQKVIQLGDSLIKAMNKAGIPVSVITKAK